MDDDICRCALICGCYGAGDEDDYEDTYTRNADWEAEDHD